MFLADVSTALGAAVYIVWVVFGGVLYLSLVRQVAARRSTINLEPPPVRTFGLPETVIALALISWFLLNVVAGLYVDHRPPTQQDIVANLFLNIGALLFLAAFLKFRQIDLNALAGFAKVGIVRTVLTGGLLLFAAYPLIALADTFAQNFYGAGHTSRQPIVELFTGSETLGQRVLIIFLAVVVAPVFEEFVFRFFLYGVFKRYFGWFLALVLNAALFALVHLHLPSLVPLFVLGSCLTLAYEWSGSILVSMTMHSLFNSIMLTALAFPEIFPQ